MLDVIADAGLSIAGLTGTLIKATLLWFVVALVVSIVLFLLLRRVGWLDIGPDRTRWSRVIFGLILFLIAGPAATATGVVGSARNEVCDLFLDQTGRIGLSASAGQVALLPLAIARDMVEPAASRATTKADLEAKYQPETDVSFLLAERKDFVVSALTGRLLDRILADKDASMVERLVVRMVLKEKLGSLEKRLALYRELLEGLRPGADGKLTWEAAGTHVGRRLIKRYLLPTIRAPFNNLMLTFGLIATLPPLLWITGIRIAGLVRQKRLSVK